METIPSFAPLAARLAAHAAAVRPVDGARDDLAKVAALVVCALLDMLICVCAALDARAAAGLHTVASVSAARPNQAAAVTAPRAERQAPPSERPARRPGLAPEACAVAPTRAALRSEAVETTPVSRLLTWSRDPGPIQVVPAPPWRPRRETRLFHLHLRTLISLRYCNCLQL